MGGIRTPDAGAIEILFVYGGGVSCIGCCWCGKWFCIDVIIVG